MRVVRSPEIELPILKDIVRDLSEYYFTSLSEKQIEMYAQDLLAMGSELTIQAVSKYRKGFGNTEFPLPVILKQEIQFYDEILLDIV